MRAREILRPALNRTEAARFNYAVNASIYDPRTETMDRGFAFAAARDLERRRQALIMRQLCDRSFKL